MRILAVLTYYHPHWTGLTAYAKRIAEGLAARGHSVTVLTTRHRDDLPAEEVYNGVRIVRVKPVARLSRGVISGEFPGVANRLIAESDLVQIHTPLLESLLVALLCRRHDVPLLFTHHGDLVMPDGFANQVIERLMVAQMTGALNLADHITTHSQDYGENSDFLWPFAEKMSFIYPPADIPAPDLDAAARWRADLGLTERKLVGFAGRFVEEKGFDYLLQAIPHVIAQMPEAHFVYAGEHKVSYEDFYSQCKPLIDRYSEHITFLGLILDPQQLANFYAMVDVFALPSRTDCFPSVQIEALLCGTPLVTANIPGAREVVRASGMGLLVEPRNPLAMANGLVEVLRDPAAYTKSPEHVHAIFNLDRTIDEYEALMCRLAGQPAPPVHAPTPPVHLYDEPLPDVPLTRYPTGRDATSWFSEADNQLMDRLLKNEMDPAYSRRARRLLDYLELRDGATVLDCGCGYGFFSMAMSHLRDLTVVGLDGDFSRIAKAQEDGIKGHFLSGDAQRLPFADQSFDCILLTEVLEHLPDDRTALRELYRILKPGGVLAISVPHTDYPTLWDPITRLWTRFGGEPFRTTYFGSIWEHHERLYRPKELLQRVHGAGFAVEACEEIMHYAVPMTPYVVYGIGKRVIEANILPKKLLQSTDRMKGTENQASALNPFNLARRFIMAVDALNDRPEVARHDTFMNILLKARRPVS
jgi:glycosyltransferase involved in cell wall biosynthesis/ubiquinone/menaquinone biosynthesis C-methylase UbiE